MLFHNISLRSEFEASRKPRALIFLASKMKAGEARLQLRQVAQVFVSKYAVSVMCVAGGCDNMQTKTTPNCSGATREKDGAGEEGQGEGGARLKDGRGKGGVGEGDLGSVVEEGWLVKEEEIGIRKTKQNKT